ncbi:hypothetical protein D3C73_974500 [compost metagenome]
MVQKSPLIRRFPELIGIKRRQVRHPENLHRIRVSGNDGHTLRLILVVCLLHRIFNIPLDCAVDGQLEVAAVNRRLIGILRVRELNSLTVTLVVELAVGALKLLVKIFFQPHDRHAVPVRIAQNMRSQRILRIIPLLFRNQSDTGFQYAMLFLKPLVEFLHLVGQLFVNLPALITNLAVLEVIAVLILGLDQLLELIHRFAQQLMETFNHLIPDSPLRNNFRIDNYRISRYVTGQHASVAVLNRPPFRLDHRGMRPLGGRFFMPEFILQDLDPEDPDD